jgi:hypothetical protein
MKKACLVGLLTWAVLSAVYWYVLRTHIPAPANIWVSLVAGLFMGVVIGTIRIALAAAADARRVRRAVEPGGFASEQPADGDTIAVAGTIRPAGEALVAPFSHRRAVLYRYEIEHQDLALRGDMRDVKDYSGFALTPSVIDSMRGAVKLLCFPQLESVDKDVVQAPDAASNAAAYIRDTQWTSMEGFNPAQIVREVREVLTDDDGQVRKDWHMSDVPNLEGAMLMEEVVAPGAQVFAIGKWSAEKRGLVPDNGIPARLVVGDARNVLASLRRKVMGNLIGAILFGAVVNTVLYLVVKYGRAGH